MFMRVSCIAVVVCGASVAVAEQKVTDSPAKVGVQQVGVQQVDVQLVDGALCGQLYSQAGQVIGGAGVALHDTQGQLLSACETKQDGRFAFASTRPGAYLLVVAGQRTVVRAWAPGTAPPTAGQGILVTVGDSVRGRLGGKRGDGGLGGIGGVGVLMVGGVIATVVTVATTNNSGS